MESGVFSVVPPTLMGIETKSNSLREWIAGNSVPPTLMGIETYNSLGFRTFPHYVPPTLMGIETNYGRIRR